jgi:hypothetical protein
MRSHGFCLSKLARVRGILLGLMRLGRERGGAGPGNDAREGSQTDSGSRCRGEDKSADDLAGYRIPAATIDKLLRSFSLDVNSAVGSKFVKADTPIIAHVATRTVGCACAGASDKRSLVKCNEHR